MQCPKCGEELPDGARFCFACGEPIAPDVPAPKRLEDPLDPALAAGAVPLRPVVPPPRATRVGGRGVKARAGAYVTYPGRPSQAGHQTVRQSWESDTRGRSSRQVMNDAIAEKDDLVVRMENPEAVEAAEAREAVREVAATLSPAVSKEAARVAEAAQRAPRAAASVARSFAGRARAAGRAVAGRVTRLRPRHGVAIGVAVAALALIAVFLVRFSTSWIGPFADRTEQAPQVEPPSDGSIEPLGTSDDGDSGDGSQTSDGAPQVRDAVEDYSWEELSQVADLLAAEPSQAEVTELAASYNLCAADGSLDGSQTKELQLTDGSKVTMRIAGFCQDELADGSGKAGITFIASTSAGSQPMDENGDTSEGWEGSSLRAWMAQTLAEKLPSDLSDHIVAAKKRTNQSPSSGGGEQQVTEDKLWLPSYSEVVGSLDGTGASRAGSYQPEGDQYQLFSDAGVRAGVTLDLLAIGGSELWWLRSPDVSNEARFMCVAANGETGWGYRASTPNAVLIGFCL